MCAPQLKQECSSDLPMSLRSQVAELRLDPGRSGLQSNGLPGFRTEALKERPRSMAGCCEGVPFLGRRGAAFADHLLHLSVISRMSGCQPPLQTESGTM